MSPAVKIIKARRLRLGPAPEAVRMKVALYARVSTRDKGQNPEMQLAALRDYCTAAGHTITKEYIDKAESADLAGRREWTALLKDASLRKFDALLIWKLDRAFRSVVHASNTLATLDGYGIKFRSLNDAAIDTTTPNGMLVFHILAAVAEFEKSLIVMRVNEGVKYAQAHGTKSGKAIGRPPASISLQMICKAVYTAAGNYSEAGRLLSQAQSHKIKAGFISLRLKRAGIDKNDVLQTPGRYFEAAQIQSKVLKP
jgi:DNA invertase Pin-like site-specific DNA recombinase